MKTELKTYSANAITAHWRACGKKNASYLESFRKQTDLANILVDSHRYQKSVDNFADQR